MKVRKKNLCDTCRKRKLQCDGKRPACTQCVFSKRTCEGYPDALFVPFDATKTAVKPRARPKSAPRTKLLLPVDAQCPSDAEVGCTQAKDESTRLPPQAAFTSSDLPPSHGSYSPDPSIVREKVSLILRNFIPVQELPCNATHASEQCSWFCGSWAKALPELTADMTGPYSQCLYSAVSALALAITAYRDRRDCLNAVVAQYEDSLRLLGESLAVVGDAYRSELVAAVMCLALTEVLSPTQESSWLIHVEGVSKMFQLMPPEIFASGIEHTMLMGFRPLLVLKAFILRKSTFFADGSWLTLPFQHHKGAPLQSLLGVAAHIPGLLEKIDVVLPTSPNAAAVGTAGSANQLIIELMGSISQLKNWHSGFLANTLEPISCRQSVERDLGGTYESLWYPSLGIANVFVYFWAFQLLCLKEIQGLLNRFPGLKHAVHDDAAYSPEALREECLELSTCIYKSMEYLLQEDFMLYGISSAGFPLSMACEALQADADGRAIMATLDQSIVTRARLRNL